MIIGYWHRKNQLSVEQEAIVNNNKGCNNVDTSV